MATDQDITGSTTTERGCPECGAEFVERTHGGDIAVYACGSESSMCADGCCGDIERTEACRRACDSCGGLRLVYDALRGTHPCPDCKGGDRVE